jgi:hypothetical protein
MRPFWLGFGRHSRRQQKIGEPPDHFPERSEVDRLHQAR